MRGVVWPFVDEVGTMMAKMVESMHSENFGG